MKANSNFRDLQAQLEGTENRISTERMRFNKVAQSYNTSIRKFPTSIIASISGFERKSYFEAENVPKMPQQWISQTKPNY